MTTPITHKVVAGDTLFSLAKKYGLTVNELKAINNLQTDRINVGLVLDLVPIVHKVVSGDTLYSLAKRYKTTVGKLKLINGLKTDSIKVGQVLVLVENKYAAQFVLCNEEGQLFENFIYEITLSDGSIRKGKTDATGCIETITSNSELVIKSIKIFSHSDSPNCCQSQPMFAAREWYEYTAKEYYDYILLDYLRLLNPNLLLRQVVTLGYKRRNLHQDERAFLKIYFGDSLDYDAIKIHRGRMIAGQKSRVAMTPLGEAYFPPEIYQENFCAKGINIKAKWLFVHEIVHVWQFQLWKESGKFDQVLSDGLDISIQRGYTYIARFPDKPYAYNYEHLVNKRNHLSEFNMEQQADIIADYLVSGVNSKINSDILFKFVREFINNPRDKSLLPKSSGLAKTVDE